MCSIRPTAPTFFRSCAPERVRRRLTIPLHDRLRLATAESEIARAILFAHEMLTGVTGDARARLEQAELERQHGAAEISAIDDEANALSVVDDALRATEEALRRDADVSTEPKAA